MSIYWWVYALSSAQKKLILENFQQQQYELLFESDIDFFDDEDAQILNISRRLNIYDSIVEKIEDSKSEAEQKSESLGNVIASLEGALASIDADIEATNEKIRNISNKIVATKKQANVLAEEMNQLQERIAASNEVLLEYVVYTYKKSNTLYLNDDIDHLSYILLNNQDVTDIIDDLYYKSLAQVAGSNIIAQHRSLVKQLYSKKLTLQRDQVSLKSLRSSELVAQTILEDKKAFRERLLEASQWKQSQYTAFIQEQIEKEKSINIKAVSQKIQFRNIQNQLLEKHGCSFVDISQNSPETRVLSKKCLNLNKIIYSEAQLDNSETGDANPFVWPVIPSWWISAYFRDAGYRDHFWADHNAIDLPVEQGSSIRAGMSGYIIHVETPRIDGYGFVAIKHPDGFVSVYGHLSEVMVEPFDFVEQWEVFALSGGEYGTPWAWYLSTGPHLHFEIYRDKKYVDPLNFMDISIFPLTQIDEKYRYKYYADFKARKWYDYQEDQGDDWKKRFNIQWNSEIERQKYLLNTYARSDFRDWDMWVSAALDAKIDPTFVMCIGLAESWLGRSLKTSYNVWNVGNTDSWSVLRYPNPESWIYAITRTLNNRFLGQYDTMDKLSCYGNTEAKICNPEKPVGHFIYASSPDHWQNNIVKCMSHVKAMYVPDDYNFRID